MIRHAALLGLLTLAAAAAAAETGGSARQNYVLRCQGCHGAGGRSADGRVPALADTVGPLLQVPAGRDFLLRVPGSANSALGDAELAAVANWMVEEYSTPAQRAGVVPFTAADVHAARQRPLVGVASTRAEITAALAARGIALPKGY